jgi:aryl-alcohol dehydrogenase-like predicted oxidoreductase
MRLAQRGPAFSPDAVPRDRDEAIAVVRRAVELGVDHVDTAAFYFSSRRSANELLRAALGEGLAGVAVATKVGPRRDAVGTWGTPARPDELRGEVEENLRQLGVDHLAVVNYRRQAGPIPVAEHVAALDELRAEGLVGAVGVSGVTLAELEEAAAAAPIACVQNNFSLSRRDDADVLAACGARGIAYVPFFAIAGRGGHVGHAEVPQAVAEVAAATGATPAQVLLAWTLHQGPHVLAIPGTGDLAHLDANVAAASLSLDAAQLARLDAQGRTAG